MGSKAKGNRPPQRLPVCAFCGGRPITGEHIIPQWVSKVIPKTGKHYFNARRRRVRDWVHIIEERSPQGDLASKEIRAFCGPCNNNWMSDIEDAMSAIARPLLVGDAVELTPGDMQVIARWAVLKSMVIEWDQPQKVTVLPAVREKFRQDQIVPSDWRVYLGVYDGPPNDRILLYRRVWAGVPPMPEISTGREMEFGQETTFVLGRLLLVATSANQPFLQQFEMPGVWQIYLLPLLPPPDVATRWPCREGISPSIRDGIADAFARWLDARIRAR